MFNLSPIFLPSEQVIKQQIIQKQQNQSWHKCTGNIHKHQTNIFRSISPFGIQTRTKTRSHEAIRDSVAGNSSIYITTHTTHKIANSYSKQHSTLVLNKCTRLSKSDAVQHISNIYSSWQLNQRLSQAMNSSNYANLVSLSDTQLAILNGCCCCCCGCCWR